MVCDFRAFTAVKDAEGVAVRVAPEARSGLIRRSCDDHVMIGYVCLLKTPCRYHHLLGGICRFRTGATKQLSCPDALWGLSRCIISVSTACRNILCTSTDGTTIMLHSSRPPFCNSGKQVALNGHIRLMRQHCCDSFRFSPFRGIRVGEAKNPGPDSWKLAVRNIVSATTHLSEVTSSSIDCQVWSETAANAVTLDRLRKTVRSRRAFLASSAPWEGSNRSAGLRGGKAQSSGVLISARSHAKSLHEVWDAAVWKSARIADMLLQIGNIQVRVIGLYGFHSGIANALDLNETLYQAVFSNIVGSHLPTIVAGDLNLDIEQLGCWATARDHGYVDVGAKWASLSNSEPVPTYRGTSRLDYIICNPQAFRALSSFWVDPQGYTDHAVLHAEFCWERAGERIPHWSMPMDIAKIHTMEKEFKEAPISSGKRQHMLNLLQAGATAEGFAEFTKAFEQKIDDVHMSVSGSRLPQKFRGRFKGAIQSVSQANRNVHPAGNVISLREGFNRRSRAISRLQHLHHLMSKQVEVEQCAKLWHKLLNDTSFSPTFGAWLLDADICNSVPWEVPNLAWLDEVVPLVLTDFEYTKVAVGREQMKKVKTIFHDDWRRGGRMHASSVKDPPAAPLQSLTRNQSLSVVPLRVAKGEPARFRVQDPAIVQVGSVWVFSKSVATVVRIQDNVVYLDRGMAVDMYKRCVNQKAWCTDPFWIYSQVKTFWDDYWNNPQTVSVDEVSYLVEAIPALPAFDCTITPGEVAQAIRSLPTRKARGMDGWSNYELKLLSEGDVEILAALYNSILQTGVWPDQLCHGLVTLLAKIDNPETPKHGRPVTILPVLYRLFGKIMSKKVFTHWQGHLPESLFGSVPGRSSIDAAWQLASQIELAMSEGSELFGVSLDLSKAYNTLHRNILSALALRAGWPPQLVRAYVNYLNSVQRYFRIGDGCYGPQGSKVGVPEGCPLAVPAMILFTWAITNHAWSQGHCLTSYVDNWAVQTHCRRSVTEFLQLVHRATSSLKLILNPEKTRAYSTTCEGRSYLRSLSFQGFPLAVTLKVSDLGVDFNSSKQATCSLLMERISAAEPKLRRLRAMPWSHTRKAQVLLKVVHPAVSFGCEFASTAPSTCVNLRGKYSSAIWGLASTRNHFLSPLLGLGVQYDPFILFLTTRLSTLRRQFCHNAAVLYSNWNAAMQAAPAFGPLSYLFAQLQILGWRILPHCTCATSAGLHVNLCLTSKKTLRELLLNSWWVVVEPKLPSQPGYELASNVNVTHTMCLRRATQASVPIIGSFTVGAALSSKQKRHF